MRAIFRQAVAATLVALSLWGPLFSTDADARGHHAAHHASARPQTIITQIVVNKKDSTEVKFITENLWGTWLLQTAMLHDDTLQELLARQGKVDSVTSGLITGTAAISLAQSITAYNANAVNPTNNLGLIASAAPLALLGIRGIAMSSIQKKIQARQSEIIEQIGKIVADLESGKPPSSVQESLNAMVGAHAAKQFLKLWSLTEDVNTPPETNTTSPAIP